ISGNWENPPLEVLQKYAQYIDRLEFGGPRSGQQVPAPPEYFFLQGCSSLTKLAYAIKIVPHYGVSDLLEKNIQLPMELYDPNENTEDSDNFDTSHSLFDDLDPVIATEQNPSQSLESVGSQAKMSGRTTLDSWRLVRYFVSTHASSLREITLTCSAPTLAFWETLTRDCSMTLESLTLVTDQIEQKMESANPCNDCKVRLALLGVLFTVLSNSRSPYDNCVNRENLDTLSLYEY
ncbi:hypothetical protein BGX20_002316, partial [Mortierella sp. AD010]